MLWDSSIMRGVTYRVNIFGEIQARRMSECVFSYFWIKYLSVVGTFVKYYDRRNNCHCDTDDIYVYTIFLITAR